MLPSIHPEPERYKGRPLVLFLEFYILDTIGELGAKEKSFAETAVEKTFGKGDWRLTLRKTLKLGDTLDASIVSMWKRNQEIAVQHNETILPVQFAKMMVDQNFAAMIDRID